MKKSLLILIILASALTVLGLALMCISFGIWGFEIRNVSLAGEYEIRPNEHPVWTDFENIEINTSFQNVNIIPSTDGKTRIVADETQKIYSTVEVVGETLKIRYVDTRMWFERIGIQVEDISLTLYLPEGDYDKLNTTTASGDIDLSDGFAFENIKFNTGSGDIDASGVRCDTGVLSANTASGEAVFNGFVLSALDISTSSGDIEFKNCTIGTLDVNTASGDVELDMLDSSLIKINTASGEVFGTLKSDKNYFIKTASGNIRIPQSVSSAPECHINTASGNVTLSVIGK